MHLVVLRRPEHRGRDENGGHVQGDPAKPHHEEHHEDREERRDHGHEARGPAPEDEEEDGEDDGRGEAEALHQGGDEVGADLLRQETLAHDADLASAEERHAGAGFRPELLHDRAEVRDPGRAARRRQHVEAGRSQGAHVDVGAERRLTEE